MRFIRPTAFAGVALNRGERLRVVDVNGGQVADLTAFCQGDPTEWLSNGRSFDYGERIYFTTGDTLYSNKSRPMLRIVEDAVGRHDFLFTACSPEMYRIQYGIEGPHPNCLDNLRRGLEPLALQAHQIPTPFNIFMNVDVGTDGRLVIHPPLSKKGDSIVLRAEMNLAVALSACPAPRCNGGTTGPIGYEIVPD